MHKPELQIHPANAVEREAAFRNVFEFWPMGSTEDEHLRIREQSVQHQRAEWWVAVSSGIVVASLGVYPTKFRVGSEVFPGISIGAVHTHPDYRGQGIASELLQTVEVEQAQAGILIGMLFSDIDPHFYTRLGYQTAPSFEFHCDWSGAMFELQVAEDPSWQCKRLEELPTGRLTELFDRPPTGRALVVEHDPSDWAYQQSRLSNSWVIWQDLLRPPGHHAWLLQLCPETANLQLLHFHDFPTGAGLQWPLNGIRAMANQQPCEIRSISGWCPHEKIQNLPAARINQRKREITMLKSFHADLTLHQQHLDAARWLHSLDHV